MSQLDGKVVPCSAVAQIEHWEKIEKIAEENAGLSYEFIVDSLIAKAELDNDLVDDYEFEF